MKSDVRAGQLRAASDPRYMKHWPCTFTVIVSSRKPSLLIMTAELETKELHFYLFTTTSLTGKGRRQSFKIHVFVSPEVNYNFTVRFPPIIMYQIDRDITG